MRLYLKTKSFNRGERGSVLVICMVLAALGTLGIAAWISLLTARSQQAEVALTALERHAVFQNSRALTQEAIYANHLHVNSTLTASATYTLPDGLGSTTISPFSTIPLSTESSQRSSQNSLSPKRSFTTDVTATINDGVGSYQWEYQLRSYNPVLGGELLTFYPPVDYTDSDPLIQGDLTVNGRAVFWDAIEKDLSSGLKADEIVLPNDTTGSVTLVNSDGGSTIATNYPIQRQTTGFTGSSPSYKGGLDLIDSTQNEHNTYAGKARKSGDYEEIDGSLPTARGGLATNVPPGPTDSTLASSIDQAEAGAKSSDDLRAELAAAQPLSSAIMQQAIDRSNALTASHLWETLQENSPLPSDVIPDVIGEADNRLTTTQKDALFDASQVWFASSGDGHVRVNLGQDNLPHLILSRINYLHLAGSETFALLDEDAEDEPRIIVVDNPDGTGLAEVLFEHGSKRRFVLAVRTGTPTPAAPGTHEPIFRFEGNFAFAEWHTILELENTGARFDTDDISSARIIGGIRTNRRLEVISGSLSLEQQFETEGLETLVSRNAWIEAYRK